MLPVQIRELLTEYGEPKEFRRRIRHALKHQLRLAGGRAVSQRGIVALINEREVAKAVSAKKLFAGGVGILPKISAVAGQPMLDVASGNDAQCPGLFFEGPPIECSEGTGEFSLLWGLSLLCKSIHSALQSSKRAVSASVAVNPEHVVRQEKIKL